MTPIARRRLACATARMSCLSINRAVAYVVEAQQQANQRRLARPGQADETYFFAGPHPQRQPIDHRLAGFIGEVDILETDLPTVDSQFGRVRPVDGGGRRCHHRHGAPASLSSAANCLIICMLL